MPGQPVGQDVVLEGPGDPLSGLDLPEGLAVGHELQHTWRKRRRGRR